MLTLALVWTAIIFIGCSLPGRDLPPITVFDHFDKVVHFVFFFVFAIFWLAAFGARNMNHYLIVVIMSMIYGFALEYYQINFVSGRSWDVWDAISDTVGGIVGCITFSYFIRIKG